MDSCNKSSSTNKSHIKNKALSVKLDRHCKSTDPLKCEKSQLKSDQLRQTQTIDNRLNGKEEIAWQERVKQVMDLTRRTEDEVIMALHDSDGDLDQAVNDLLEGVSPEWEVKKKKARPSGIPKQNPEVFESQDCDSHWDDRRHHADGSSRSRNRDSMNNRGWRRRENKENEKNVEDFKLETDHSSIRKGRSVPGKSGRGGRAAGRLGPRTFANRVDSSSRTNPQSFPQSIETWTGNENQSNNRKEAKIDSWNTSETNEDWDNEEYTGSLADTKVFTPSTINNTISVTNQDEGITVFGNSDSATALIHNPQKQVKHRPRMPPPSKIPSSAVEMPGDSLNSTISFLDVQFGALEFGGDANIAEGSNYDKHNSPHIHKPNAEPISIASKAAPSSVTTITTETVQVSSQKYGTAKNMLHCDSRRISNEETINNQSGFPSRKTGTPSVDIKKEDLDSQASFSNSQNFNPTSPYQSTKSSFATPVTTSSFSAYSRTESSQSSFASSTTDSNTNSFSTMPSVTQTGFNSYKQHGITTFNQTSSANSSGSYNQPSTSNSVYQPTPGLTATPISQYQTSSSSTNVSSSNTSYMSTGFTNPSTFQSAPQTFHPSSTTFVSSISQGSSVYSNTVQSVYSNTYNSYGGQSHVGSQDCKLNASKDLQFENNTTTTSAPLVTTSACNLGLSSSSVNTSQTKTTTNTVPKSTISNLTPSSSIGTSSISSSSNNGSITPILSHQYIMGQSVPYAAFQQPHMYSYEDLQLMQQRMPHMPTTGYYDATLGYQTTGPVTSLGNSRSDALSSVQGVQGVQTVQGQYTSINDARYARSDSNSSPVSSTISQQTATQHQQPLINPIPPGYAYFYGGGIMPASGFQYGTPALYPQIATAASAVTTSGAYNTKPATYNSGYGSGTSYDTLTSSGPSGDYKSPTSGYVNSQSSKSSPSTGNTNTAPVSAELNSTMYTKGHVALNKVNSYEKQAFHSATPPPFGLTSNQNANVISGYGAAHLFIPTVPHQLHQPLHQESSSSSGSRPNTNTQSKTQVKSGYSTSYWAGSN